MEGEETKLLGVGAGLGVDSNFMDRMARISGTNEEEFSPRVLGKPAEYEQRMIEIFTQMIKALDSRLVN